MRVHGPLLINVVTMCNMPMLTMLAREGEVTRGVDTRADQGSMTIDNWVTGHLVDWVTIVTVIMYRDGPACAATHCGGNCWKIKSEKIVMKCLCHSEIDLIDHSCALENDWNTWSMKA